METELDISQGLIESGNFAEAFRKLKKLVLDDKLSTADRATAYQMLGSLVLVCPSLGDEDECGLSYYKQALEFDPNNLWAHYGIVSTLGVHFPDHQDVRSARRSLATIQARIDELPDSAHEIIVKRLQLLENFK